MKQCYCCNGEISVQPDSANCDNYCTTCSTSSVSYTATGVIELGGEQLMGKVIRYSASASASASATGSTLTEARLGAFKLAKTHANRLVQIKLAQYLKSPN